VADPSAAGRGRGSPGSFAWFRSDENGVRSPSLAQDAGTSAFTHRPSRASPPEKIACATSRTGKTVIARSDVLTVTDIVSVNRKHSILKNRTVRL